MEVAKTKGYKRIAALDIIRGLFILMIIVDHLNWGPSLYHLMSGGGVLWVSPAEGFFAISGILVGYIYGPRLAKSFWGATKKLWKRAWLLYSLSVVFTMVFTAIALHAHSSALPPLWPRDGFSFLYNTLLGRYAYGWTDFLPRYAVFMLISPAILWLITRGKAWIVALASITAWALFHTTAALLPFSSWELIFIPAIIVGYYLPHIEAFVAKCSRRVRYGGAIALWGAAVVSFSVLVVLQIALPMLGHVSPLTAVTAQFTGIFDKETIGIGRFLLGVVWFWALYSVVRCNEQRITRATRGVLATIGAKSLYAYSIHGCVVFLVTILITPPADVSVVQSTVFSTIIMLVIYIATISPALAKWCNYEYHKYLVGRLIRYQPTSQEV